MRKKCDIHLVDNESGYLSRGRGTEAAMPREPPVDPSTSDVESESGIGITKFRWNRNQEKFEGGIGITKISGLESRKSGIGITSSKIMKHHESRGKIISRTVEAESESRKIS